MTLLQVFFIVSGVIIFILALDIAKKEKFNALHFLVFIAIGIALLVFTFAPGILNSIGQVFGVQRGADVLVYVSIIFLLYFSLLLLTKSEANKHATTKLVRELAISQSSQVSYSGNGVILVRVYNEEEVLEKTLEHIWGTKKDRHTNILIIDDGSKDNSYNIAQKFSQRHENIIVVRHSQNRGGGAALETGFEYIRRYLDVPFIITFDADGQHSMKDIQTLKDSMTPELGVVFGSRFVDGGDATDMPMSRRIILFLGKIFTSLISGSTLTDPHNGYRIFKKETIEKIHLTADDMSYASELIEQIMNKKIPYAEAPVHVLYTDYSLSKGQRSMNAISIGLYTIWKKFFQ